MAKSKTITNKTITHNGAEYILDVNIFQIDGKYYLKNEVNIDTYTNKMAPTTALLRYNHDGKYKYTSKAVTLIGELYGGGVTSCKSVVDSDKNFIPYISRSNTFININDRYIWDTVRPEKIYNLSQYNKEFSKKFDITSNLSELLKGYTFGFEIETSKGYVSEPISRKFQFAQLYDGSIDGVEFTSTPFTVNNLHYLSNFLVNLNTAFAYNEYCSLHIHVGGVKYTEENLLVIYTLYQRLQDELNSVIAPYRKDPKYIGTKNKDHCRNLPRLLKPEVNEVYRLFLGDNWKNLLKEDFLDSNSKWNVHGRYYNVNLLNYIFRPDNQKTIEIRNSQSSFDLEYILTWLLINVSVIDYAIKNSKKILDNKEKILLHDCIDEFTKDNPDIKTSINYNLGIIKNIIYNEYHVNERLMINELGRDSSLFKNKLRKLYFEDATQTIDYNLPEIPEQVSSKPRITRINAGTSGRINMDGETVVFDTMEQRWRTIQVGNTTVTNDGGASVSGTFFDNLSLGAQINETSNENEDELEEDLDDGRWLEEEDDNVDF